MNRTLSVYDGGMEDITFLQEALKRIHSHKGVRGSIIVNADGIPLRSTSHPNMHCCVCHGVYEKLLVCSRQRRVEK